MRARAFVIVLCMFVYGEFLLYRLPLLLYFLQQDEYEGLINEVVKEECSEDDGAPRVYSFGISSLVNKREPLQNGDKVSCRSLFTFVIVKNHVSHLYYISVKLPSSSVILHQSHTFKASTKGTKSLTFSPTS